MPQGRVMGWDFFNWVPLDFWGVEVQSRSDVMIANIG
jgi:hypothetical protein